jgi:hypothetical protein
MSRPPHSVDVLGVSLRLSELLCLTGRITTSSSLAANLPQIFNEIWFKRIKKRTLEAQILESQFSRMLESLPLGGDITDVESHDARTHIFKFFENRKSQFRYMEK